jgi:mRNA-degrading endonuclease RelE of RelBE toxin-antitoxin system
VLREVMTIFDAISNLSDNPLPPQSKRLTGREGWRLRVVSYRAIKTVRSREITLFAVKVAHRNNINKSFFTKRSQFRVENRCMIKPVISC